VIEGLGQPAGVAAQQADIARMLDLDGHLGGLGLLGPALGGVPHQLGDVHVGQVQGHFVGVDLGHVQHVVDRPRQLGGGGPHRRGVGAAALGKVLAGALEQLGIADDGGKRRA